MATKTTKKSSSKGSVTNGKKSRSGGVSQAAATYFLSITLQNIRCFGEEAQTLDLSDREGRPAQWTVLLGNNGTGKTTLLQCLAGIEPQQTARFGNDQKDRTFPRIYNALNGVLITDLTRRDCTDKSWFKVLTSFGPPLESKETPYVSSDSKFAPASNSGYTLIGGTIEPPIVYGYGANRRFEAKSLLETAAEDGAQSLFFPHSNLRNAEEWLLQLDYSASKRSAIQGGQKKRLEQVREILLKVLPDIDAIRFTHPTKAKPTPSVEFKTPFGWVSLKQLGLGYQTLIAWMVDFASRMVDRYPDSNNPLAEPAVVLVDEIDLHLHPTWQRKVMSHLTNLFPNTQFIVTAHSPLIVQAAANANIALLRREGDHVVIDNDLESIRGWRIDQILTSDLYGLETARPLDMEEDLKKRKKLLTKARLTKAEKKELDPLEKKIGFLPGGETGKEAGKMMELLEKSNRLLEKYQSQ